MTKTPRVRSQLFAGGAFGFTIAALIAAPLAAAADVFHSYTPFLLLRVWVVGFCWYGNSLAIRAGGLRRSWQVIYALIGLPYLFVWGLPVEVWMVIDLTTAFLIGVSVFVLRTEAATHATP